MKDKIKCPVCKGKDSSCVACKGKGNIEASDKKNYKSDADGKNRRAAIILRNRNYTLRQIAKILGYKHPQSIQSLLNKK